MSFICALCGEDVPDNHCHYYPADDKQILRKEENMKHSEYIMNARNNLSNCINIMIAKSKDYAKDHNPFANFDACEQFGVTREKGILIRISDKISRIGNLLDKEAHVKDESIHDTINDAINYLNIISISLTEKETENGGEETKENEDQEPYRMEKDC